MMASVATIVVAAITQGGFAIDMVLAITAGIGVVLALSTIPWFSRKPVLVRLSPYVTRSQRTRTTPNGLGIRATLEPLLDVAGRRLNSALGMVTDLDTRLIRAGRSEDTYRFRVRQLTLALGGLGTGVIIWAVVGPPRLITVCLVIGSPVLAVLSTEQALTRAIRQRQERVTAELPVVIEQLGMLVSAGFSLSSAVSQIGARGTGVVASDLRVISRSIRRGVEPLDAFAQWAKTSGLISVERVVSVLALNSQASDLGSLISSEARSIRAEAHRDLLETIERRAQLVWIPVTVATLVPGLIFLAVPFYSAMSKITGS